METEKTQSGSDMTVSQPSSSKGQNKITVMNDGVLAKIVVFDKENLDDQEICRLLNIYKYTKMEVIKHFTRIESVDRHHYTVYNVLI